MTKTVPVHTLTESDESSCKVLRLNPLASVTDTTEAHRHNYYEILFFSKGGGTHMIDFEQHEISSSSLHFVSPGQIHALTREKGVEGYVVIFTKEFMLLNGGNMNLLGAFPAFNRIVSPLLELAEKDYTSLLSLVLEMQHLQKSNGAMTEESLAAYTNLLLIRCQVLLMQTSDYRRNDEPTQLLMQRFNTLLEADFIDLHKVSEYAGKLNVTPNHLSETVKRITGKTAGELIHQRLILEAKRLLLHSAMTAKEVAYTLNFNDPSYFSRFFKINTGHSPESFRKDIRKKYHH